MADGDAYAAKIGLVIDVKSKEMLGILLQVATNEIANVVVAKDGTGHFTTLTDAVRSIPSIFPGRYVICLKSGLYEENVEINKPNITIIGDEIGKSVLRSNRNVVGGYDLHKSAALCVFADTFIGKHLTFQNVSVPIQDGQAVALSSNGDRSAFYQCEMISYQDTLLVTGGRQFFRDCNIYGAIDFIFGDSAMLLQKCNIYVRGSGWITAQGRKDQSKNTGISIDQCRIEPTSEFKQKRDFAYLGRPWMDFSRVIVMKTYIDGIIKPAGWEDWCGRGRTAEYMEFGNYGPGAVDCVHGPKERVRWPNYKLFCNNNEVEPFSVSKFIDGDQWLPDTGIPYDLNV